MFVIVGLMLIFAAINAPRAVRAYREGKKVSATILMVTVVLALVIAWGTIEFNTTDHPPPARSTVSGSHDWSCARSGRACP